MNVEAKPRVYEPGELMNCTAKSGALIDEDPKVKLWLTRFHTIRKYAIRREIKKDMKIVKRAFMRSAKYGSSCTAVLKTKDVHRQTIKYLDTLGFTFLPAIDMKRNDNGSCAYCIVNLPICCEDKQMNAWVFEVRQVFFKAQAALIERHCRYIEKKFEKAAKKCKNKISIHQKYLHTGAETSQVILQRYGCILQQNRNNDEYIDLVISE